MEAVLTMPRFFVTTAGLTAAIQDTRVLNTLKSILRGEANENTIEQYLADGLIGQDRRVRDNRVDHNLIVLSGAVDRVLTILPNTSLPESRKPDGDADPHDDSHITRDLRTVPRKLYKIRPDVPPLTGEQLRQLPSGARHVYAALRRSDVGTVKILAQQTGLNRRTVENAISVLRKAGVIIDMDFKR